MKLMPQEVEVWYLIPAIRREISKILVKDYKLSQKRVSELLGITDSAVSQYIKLKRANDLKFNGKELKQIKETAKKIFDDEKNAKKYIFELSLNLRGSESLCELHRKQDPSIGKKCDICMNK
ncbi:transcriptional regulator [Candidatus Pacearchaeota archaeon CG10_big_fil_rev_8_21_14_0_10_30_48]|nr:MAG: transcriptional regulator [Candidatus Pacearchaeota archaeon CG10_big_fil_rev_8_21_14_0_10_30_48]